MKAILLPCLMFVTCGTLCAQMASASDPSSKRASRVKYENKTAYSAYSARPLQDVMYSAPATTERPSNCAASILGKAGGSITAGDLANIEVLEISGRNFEIMSYELYAVTGADMKVMAGTGKFLSQEAVAVIRQLQPGQKLLVEGIKARDVLTGAVCSLPDLKFEVTP